MKKILDEFPHFAGITLHFFDKTRWNCTLKRIRGVDIR